jgi:hypothetical protein
LLRQRRSKDQPPHAIPETGADVLPNGERYGAISSPIKFALPVAIELQRTQHAVLFEVRDSLAARDKLEEIYLQKYARIAFRIPIRRIIFELGDELVG